jgi:hypothetical protein
MIMITYAVSASLWPSTALRGKQDVSAERRKTEQAREKNGQNGM